MDLTESTKVVAEYGIIAGLLLFFVFQTWKSTGKRETQMLKRIDKLETRLLNLLEASNDVVAANTQAMREFTTVIAKCPVRIGRETA